MLDVVISFTPLIYNREPMHHFLIPDYCHGQDGQFKCLVLRGCGKLSPFFGSFDLRGIWMKVELDMTPWVLANNLGPKNWRWPNLAASWRPKPFIPLRKSIKKTMYQIKIGKKKTTKKLI